MRDFSQSCASLYPVSPLNHIPLTLSFSVRQIPYAIGQFTVNELCHEAVYRNMSEETKRSLSGAAQFNIALGSGITAGFAAAVLSQVRKFIPTIVEEQQC